MKPAAQARADSRTAVSRRLRHLPGFAVAVCMLGPAFAGLACAQEAGQEPGLPPITVRPSGVEDGRERQERLSRRLEQSEFAFRSICTHCAAPGSRPGATSPFHPVEVLQGAPVRE